MTHVPCKSKLRSVVRLSMHLCPGNWVANRCAVVYYARAAQVLSAGIKCRHCTLPVSQLTSLSQTSPYISTCPLGVRYIDLPYPSDDATSIADTTLGHTLFGPLIWIYPAGQPIPHQSQTPPRTPSFGLYIDLPYPK